MGEHGEDVNLKKVLALLKKVAPSFKSRNMLNQQIF